MTMKDEAVFPLRMNQKILFLPSLKTIKLCLCQKYLPLVLKYVFAIRRMFALVAEEPVKKSETGRNTPTTKRKQLLKKSDTGLM